MNVAVRVENLSKRYRIQACETGVQPSYRRLTEELMRLATAPLRRLAAGMRPAGNKEFWALRDINFEVERGEVVGIVGRNGAGKSTLLKIVSRISRPTTGSVRFRGRVGSLLEVGTGFHPELSGRENVFLNGSILGMPRREIQRKFDEIVAFSNIEQFIDTPVKRYSSGMRVRLGFAVAAHLDPEILIVDEVLAVGDAQFRQKCMDKMRSEAIQGRTVLFVSHNMMAVQALCDRCLLLEKGRITQLGETEEVVESYRAQIARQAEIDHEARVIPLAERIDRRGNGSLRFADVRIVGGDGSDPRAPLVPLQPATILLDFATPEGTPARNVNLIVTITDALGSRIFSCITRHRGAVVDRLATGQRVACHLGSLPLTPGEYQIDLSATVNAQPADAVEKAGEFFVSEHDLFGTGRLPRGGKHGPVLVDHDWIVGEPAATDWPTTPSRIAG